MTTTISPTQRPIEGQEPRARLADAQGPVPAVRDGNADLVTIGSDGDGRLTCFEGAEPTYRSLIESMSEGALALTAEGRVLYANRRFAEILRTPLANLLGSDIQSRVAPESRPVLHRLLRKDLVDGHREELKLAAADGTQVPVLLSASRLVLDQRPDAIGMVAFDLTDQKRNEAIIAADNLARAILERAAAAIVICDAAGRIIRASLEAEGLYGSHLLGQRFEDAFPMRQADGAWFSPFGHTDASPVRAVEARLERDGQGYDLLVSVGHLKGAHNELLGSVLTLTDITQRNLAAEETRQLAARLTMTLDSITDAFFTVDKAWRFTFVNREAERLLRRTREELLGQDMWAEFAPASGTIFEREYRRAIEANESVEFEAFYPPLDAWFGVRAYPSGQGLAVYFRDIAGRRRAEAALKERAELQRQLIHIAASVPGLIYSFKLCPDGSTRMPYASGAMMDIFDLNAADVVDDAKPALSLVHPDDIGPVNAAIAESARTMQPWSSEFRICRTRRGEIWVEAHSVPQRKPDGSVLWHGFLQDITARRAIEDALRTSEAEFRTLAESIPQLVWVARADGGAIYANQRWRDYSGLTDEATFGQGWIKPVHPDEQQRVRKTLERAMTGVGTYSIESRLRRADGVYRWFLIRGVPLCNASGEVLKWFGTFTDIDDLKLAQLEISRTNLDLRESERRFSDMLENVEMLSMMRDSKGQITYCNAFLLRLTGWQREEIIGKDWVDLFVPPAMAERKKQLFASLLQDDPEARHHQSEIVTRSGEHRLIRWNNSLLRSGAGEVTGTASIGEDVTEQKRAEVKIARLNRVYAVLSRIDALIVRVRDRDELFRDACLIAVDVGKFRMSMICSVDPSADEILPVATAGMDKDLLAAVRHTLSSSDQAPRIMIGRAIREKTAVVANDSLSDRKLPFGTHPIESGVRSMAVLPLIVADTARAVLVLYAEEPGYFDDDELKLLTELAGDIAFAIDHIDKQARLDYFAFYDSLTGLANRSLFLERAAQCVRGAASAGHKLAVIQIDVERFTSINESLGRAAGDALLKELASWLTHNQGDANLLARMDADHFAAVLPEVRTGADVALRVKTLVKEFLEHPFRVNDTVLRIAVKVGAALYPDDGADAEALLKNAEAALRHAKATGDPYAFYAANMADGDGSKLTLENQLRHALDNNEFVLHYQPKVNLASGLVTGAEALIRWNHPREGLVAPGSIIPILEETGMIHSVGRWALAKAIEDRLRWRAMGLAAVRISVNVSAMQLRSRDFLDEVRQAVCAGADAADGLELEITESVIMEDVQENIARLGSIRDLGVSIAVDDFGTGFSSLSYLSKLPLDTLKIDRSFVTDMSAGPEGLALVATIINLAHSLKLKVVAEGVESEEQSRLLRTLHCDEMQGFLFSGAVPAAIFEAKYLRSLPPG